MSGKNKKMKAAVLYGPQDVRLEEIDIPEIGPGDVLLKIKAALTCGTDAKVFLRGGHPAMIKPPAVFGHEFSGEISEVGSAVKDFKPGMRVVAANSAPCLPGQGGNCFFCKIGQQSLCDSLLYINGGYAEYVKVPETIVRQNLLEIPEGVSFAEAALVEPLACVVHGIEESNIRAGDMVVVNGAGPIGLFFVALAKLKGARPLATDVLQERLDRARKLGAEAVINAGSGEDVVERVKELTGDGRGADVVIDATGLPRVWEKAIQMVRKGGLVNLFGGCAPGTKIEIDTALIHYSEITIKGVYHHTPAYVRQALGLISEGKIDTRLFITKELSLEKIAEALKLIINHQGVKTAVIP